MKDLPWMQKKRELLKKKRGGGITKESKNKIDIY